VINPVIPRVDNLTPLLSVMKTSFEIRTRSPTLKNTDAVEPSRIIKPDRTSAGPRFSASAVKHEEMSNISQSSAAATGDMIEDRSPDRHGRTPVAALSRL
jgi:hypothetical protein